MINELIYKEINFQEMCLFAYFLINGEVEIEKCGRFLRCFYGCKQVLVAIKQA